MVAVTLVRDRGVVDVVTTALHAEKHHEARNLVTVESEVISAARAHRLGHHEATPLQPRVDRGHQLRVAYSHRNAAALGEAIGWTRASTSSRSSGTSTRPVPSATASSGMTFAAEPACNRPTDMTVGCMGSVRRLTICCNATI